MAPTHAHRLITAQRALQRAEGRSAELRAARDEAVRDAIAAGLSMRQVATNIGLTQTAVHKIAHAATS